MFFINPKSRQQATDQDLLDAFGKKQDLDDLAELFNRYVHLVYGVCIKYLKNKDDAQDAVMQIFEKLIRDVNRFEIKNFKSWLYVFSKNYCLMKIRSSKAGLSIKQMGEMQEVMENELLVHHDDETNSLEENLRALEKCIETLVAEQKQCVSLFFLKEMSYKQIIEQTGLEIKKVKSYLQNGKRNLKICMEAQ
jgi:RNA polymerase sigma factor (sigma-70 family)